MGLWHVYYASRQTECCGTPFSVGEQVSWPLLLTDADDVLGGGRHEGLSEIMGPVQDLPGDEDGSVRVLRDDTGLTVALGGRTRAGAVPGNRCRQAGLLSVETHGRVARGGRPGPCGQGGGPGVRGEAPGFAFLGAGARARGAAAAAGGRVPQVARRRRPGGSPTRGKWLMQAGVVVTLEVPEGGTTP
jgi:hypothetical protein